jgi:transcription elongation factor GreB
MPSKYITRAGYDALNQELYQLWKVERPQVTQSVQEAAAQGDRSENAEYTYGKKRLREIDRRVRFLTKRLDGMVVVDRPPDDRTRIFFGAWVTLTDASDTACRWRLVGPDELDPRRGYISIDSPMARALLGKCVAEDILLTLPENRKRYTIRAIEYED